MEDIKKTLTLWNNNKADFDAKLVAREETGCCGSPNENTGGLDTPCSE